MFTHLIKSFVIAMLISGTSLARAADKEINLKDLGFTASDTQSDSELQKTLEERRFYLRQHQIWGLISVAAMAATLATGGEGNLPPEHPYFAGLAVASYAASAYTALRAPNLPYGKKYGGTAWHRRLMWVHLPGMLLTPILGYMAAKKIDEGKKLDGIEKYHKDIAGVTAAALAISALTVSFEF